MEIKTCDRLIDIGCGPGLDTIPIGRSIGGKGFVVGVDYDYDMLEKANQFARDQHVDHRVVHLLADAAFIPFRSNSFDACRCERVIQHVKNAEDIFREMVRITRKQGKIVVADTDWATLSIDSSNVDIERRIALFRAKIYHNGYAGRQIYRLMKLVKLQNVLVEIHPIIWNDYEIFRATSFSLNNFEQRLLDSGTVTKCELRSFLAGLEEAQGLGHFYASGNIVVGSGTKQN